MWLDIHAGSRTLDKIQIISVMGVPRFDPRPSHPAIIVAQACMTWLAGAYRLYHRI